MNKQDHIKKFRKHLTDVHGEDALKDFAGSQLESLCIGYIILYVDEKEQGQKEERQKVIDAWESLPEGNWNLGVIQEWLVEDMKPVIDGLRLKQKSNG